MTRYEMLRYARYAAAVLFALLAVGFVALWVRSFFRLDVIDTPSYGGSSYTMVSRCGGTCLSSFQHRFPEHFTSWTVKSVTLPHSDSLIESHLSFGIWRDGPSLMVAFPHWFPAASSLGLAALFAFKRTWRFSLRTVLIATTLLAAILGLAVYVV